VTKKRKPAKRSVPRGGTRKRAKPAREEVTQTPTTVPDVNQAPGFVARFQTPAGEVLELHPKQLAFCEHYLENGFNATDAYRKSHPEVTNGTAAVNGFRALRNTKIRAYLAQRLEGVWTQFHMGGDEALARLAFIIHETDDDKVRIAALKVILEQTGKLKTHPQSVDALADALRQTLEQHRDV